VPANRRDSFRHLLAYKRASDRGGPMGIFEGIALLEPRSDRQQLFAEENRRNVLAWSTK